jgi:membrane protease YdiL (CAAX protease family)
MFKALRPAPFFLIVLFWFLMLFGLSVMASLLNIPVDTSDEQYLFYFKLKQALGVIAVFIFPALLMAILFSGQKLSYFLLHKAPSFRFILLSSICILVALPVIAWLEEINKIILDRAAHVPSAFADLLHWMKSCEDKAQTVEDALMKQPGLSNLFENLLVIAFMAALSEEIFFRGLLQTSLLRLTKNTHWAVWITAILFSAFHLQFYGFLPRMLLGALLGYSFAWSGSLWTSITVHFLNNALVLIMSYLLNTGTLPKSLEKAGIVDDKVSLVWVVPAALLITGGLFLLYRMKKPIRLEN